LFALVQTLLTTSVTLLIEEGSSGGGCGLVEEPPSLAEAARAARVEVRLRALNCFVSGVTLRASDTTTIFVSVIVTPLILLAFGISSSKAALAILTDNGKYWL
jgi:hypothetical protein